jgi:hypothetical protein
MCRTFDAADLMPVGDLLADLATVLPAIAAAGLFVPGLKVVTASGDELSTTA